MLKKAITYTDYNGVERTEDFYFNLNKTELIEMELSVDGGLVETIEKIVQAKDSKQLVDLFKDLVLKAYGEKSADGRRFVKNQEIRDAFSQTEAYNELFMELSLVTDAAVEFVNGIMPASLNEAKPPAFLNK